MKLNACAYELNTIFERHFNRHRTIFYDASQEMDITRHVHLIQDKDLAYYARKVHFLFFNPSNIDEIEPFLHWQIRETYRLINTILASYSSDVAAVREQLLSLKTKLETNDYLSQLLAEIDSGQRLPDLVCSGHGAWYEEDGYIDPVPEHTHLTVYSALGASITDELAIDIENEQYDGDKVMIENDVLGTREPSKFTPFTFKQHTKIPDFRMVERKTALPHPRVIEPMTGRVMYDTKSEKQGIHFISLHTVLERFPNRNIHWAACTGVRAENTSYLRASLQFFGHTWTKSHTKKRKRIEETGPDHTDQSLEQCFPHLSHAQDPR